MTMLISIKSNFHSVSCRNMFKLSHRLTLMLAPSIASSNWLTTLLILLIIWLVNGRPKYKPGSADVTFISNIGAVYDWIFITGATITAVFFVISLVQFIVRHRSRINARSVPGRPFKGRIWADIVALIVGTAGVTCLVLLTIFDSIKHENLHWILTLAFSFLTIICAIFNLVGVSAFRHSGKAIKASFTLKLVFILFGTIILGTMIGFIYSCSDVNGVLTQQCNTFTSIAAILEWILAFLLYIFMSTWVLDFARN